MGSWSDYLFDTPWWLPAVIAGVGVALFVTGNRRQEKRVQYAGVAFAVAALLLLLLSYLVQTDKEAVLANTDRLVEAVEKRDWETMNSLLDEKTTLMGYWTREDLVKMAKDSVERAGLKEVTVLSREVEQADTTITVTLTVMSDQEVSGWVRSSWQLQWQERADGWMLYRITPLEGPDVGLDAVKRWIRLPSAVEK